MLISIHFIGWITKEKLNSEKYLPVVRDVSDFDEQTFSSWGGWGSRTNVDEDPVFHWISRLADQFPELPPRRNWETDKQGGRI